MLDFKNTFLFFGITETLQNMLKIKKKQFF